MARRGGRRASPPAARDRQRGASSHDASHRPAAGQLECELAEAVLVSERFPSWEHVNVQRGVDAYLAAHAPGEQWFGPRGPGRVDLAVEIPRPDARCRERLIQVYARDLRVDAAVLASLRAGDHPPVLRGAYLTDVLAEMNSERQALTRSLLGAPVPKDPQLPAGSRSDEGDRRRATE